MSWSQTIINNHNKQCRLIFKNKNKFFTSKNPHSATCQILMNGWKVTLVWCYGYSCNELA